MTNTPTLYDFQRGAAHRIARSVYRHVKRDQIAAALETELGRVESELRELIGE